MIDGRTKKNSGDTSSWAFVFNTRSDRLSRETKSETIIRHVPDVTRLFSCSLFPFCSQHVSPFKFVVSSDFNDNATVPYFAFSTTIGGPNNDEIARKTVTLVFVTSVPFPSLVVRLGVARVVVRVNESYASKYWAIVARPINMVYFQNTVTNGRVIRPISDSVPNASSCFPPRLIATRKIHFRKKKHRFDNVLYGRIIYARSYKNSCAQ